MSWMMLHGLGDCTEIPGACPVCEKRSKKMDNPMHNVEFVTPNDGKDYYIMPTKKFIRIPFAVDAVRVTEENIDKVALWCNGQTVSAFDANPDGDRRSYIKVKVHRPLYERQTQAFVGDWILKSEKNGFRVYTNNAFEKSFQAVDNG